MEHNCRWTAVDGTHLKEQFTVARRQYVSWTMFLYSLAELPIQNCQASLAPWTPPLSLQEMKLIPSEVMEKLNREK